MTAPGAARPQKRAGSLRPGELAQASVMGALCAAIAIIAVVLPHGGGLGLLGSVPTGLLAYRYRIRVLITATVAAGVIGFLVVGLSGLAAIALCAYTGGLAGIVKRHRRGTPTVLAVSLVAAGVVGAGMVIALTVLTRLRQLAFHAIGAAVDGAASVVARVPPLHAAAVRFAEFFAAALQHWQWLVLGYALVAIVGASLVGWWALSRVLERLRGIPDVHKLDAPARNGPTRPVPVRLDRVRLRYPHADRDALRAVSLDVQAGEHVAVTGANGAGKTTLMLVLAGREPTSGTIERPGSVGLGELGGTAVVMQHPESQVLGTRVADDVVWGLPPGTTTDVGRLLGEVGLAGLADRDTGSLSGGELQRLAVAAALAREPALLIADEVTSMVDRQGREQLLTVLSGLTERHRTALVHITHYNDEAEYADRTINLGDTQGDTALIRTATAPAPTCPAGRGRRAPVLELAGVGHEYASGTPWSRTALRDVSFTVHEGDGLLIHGGNGSGKSTLAWIMAGLTVPTTGTCLLDGRPAAEQVGAVALQFQAARLQLMRSRVDLEVASAAGFSPDDHDRFSAALAAVGLDAGLAERRIDQLSGGQMRRVVLAGLLARSPRVLILDEPLAGLDAASQRGLVELLAERRRETGLTVVVISHDFAGLEQLCPRILHLRDGSLDANPVAARPVPVPVAPPTKRPAVRRRPVVLLRPVPGSSPIHELWAGTKLLVVFAMSLLLTVFPGWVAIGLATALAAAGLRLAHIPRGVLPSVPRWLWIFLGVVGVTAALAGGAPTIRLGTASLGLGGLLDFLRATALTVVLLGLGALVSWTTNVAQIAPAVATLGRPLRVLRIPVDDWSVALALALRTFPMLIDEFRVLYAARRLRPRRPAQTRWARLRRPATDLIDVVVAVITVTLRRADEMGDAITARGGTGQISAAPSRPKRNDWIALSIASAVCAAAVAAELALLAGH
ncbi:ATP-binding cassette domain-containing protein [Mycobacterium avium subsp. hominissuis]|uniref:ATP-binding cassette domain-containing protein n=1 Tax=Mycobacterium avium TaxID=1764 RepID=UPI0009FF0893|nr:ATP-binding cassette domain-containing protein [Mycobacterium avium]ATO68426.1 ATP-binding cassette domain-containing protein [Mycobacterium avium subsp. hominissuis]ATO72962.2 ATP-binding cassette domain-containing protein [Mycobacterium avium subsp. hominissuis]MBZ4559205.1 ATP-binding cassette domain-containing protein [Mycobacterium avium subsp. hominissuis]MBZ4567483.1 ATP-binding cassette domain-containing protein [Mycobacterium avium subsp. hominissuis]MBZ4586052.1 ATP-binding casset